MKNFKSEIGCVIVCKMLIYRKIRGYLEMTNENVRFFSSFFWSIQYILSYLIDKKEYRKEKNFEERIAGLKSICIFVAEK